MSRSWMLRTLLQCSLSCFVMGCQYYDGGAVARLNDIDDQGTDRVFIDYGHNGVRPLLCLFRNTAPTLCAEWSDAVYDHGFQPRVATRTSFPAVPSANLADVVITESRLWVATRDAPPKGYSFGDPNVVESTTFAEPMMQLCSQYYANTLSVCGLSARGEIWCSSRSTQRLAWDPAVRVTALGIGTDFACGTGFRCIATVGGKIRCVGADVTVDLMNRTSPTNPNAFEFAGMTNVVDVEASGDSLCARTGTGTVACAGWLAAQYVSTTSSSGFTELPGVTDAVQIALTDTHGCVRRRSGSVSCFGSNAAWERDGREGGTPRDVTTLDSLTSVLSVSVGAQESCAVLADHTVRCWGDRRGIRVPSLVIPL